MTNGTDRSEDERNPHVEGDRQGRSSEGDDRKYGFASGLYYVGVVLTAFGFVYGGVAAAVAFALSIRISSFVANLLFLLFVLSTALGWLLLGLSSLLESLPKPGSIARSTVSVGPDGEYDATTFGTKVSVETTEVDSIDQCDEAGCPNSETPGVVYSGTREYVVAGHVLNSSLPVGGETNLEYCHEHQYRAFERDE